MICQEGYPVYIVYLAAFVVFLGIELLSSNLVTVWLSISALFTSIYAYFFPQQIVVQLFIFLVLSVILIALTKPFVKKLRPKTEKTNADRLIGCEALVLEEIDHIRGSGQVKVMGQVWSAKSAHSVTIPADSLVTILRIEGVKLIVE